MQRIRGMGMGRLRWKYIRSHSDKSQQFQGVGALVTINDQFPRIFTEIVLPLFFGREESPGNTERPAS